MLNDQTKRRIEIIDQIGEILEGKGSTEKID